jgi:hypothetical protein
LGLPSREKNRPKTKEILPQGVDFLFRGHA